MRTYERVIPDHDSFALVRRLVREAIERDRQEGKPVASTFPSEKAIPYRVDFIARHLARGFPLFTLGISPRDWRARAARRLLVLWRCAED